MLSGDSRSGGSDAPVRSEVAGSDDAAGSALRDSVTAPHVPVLMASRPAGAVPASVAGSAPSVKVKDPVPAEAVVEVRSP